jgi:hypothetical protein
MFERVIRVVDLRSQGDTHCHNQMDEVTDRVGIAPLTENTTRLYATWVGIGGEGIFMKEPTSPYLLVERSPAWQKLKPKLTIKVLVTGVSAKRIRCGDWGEAVMLALAYEHPRSGELVHIRRAVRIARNRPFARRIGRQAELVCWGVTPSAMLRRPDAATLGTGPALQIAGARPARRPPRPAERAALLAGAAGRASPIFP